MNIYGINLIAITSNSKIIHIKRPNKNSANKHSAHLYPRISDEQNLNKSSVIFFDYATFTKILFYYFEHCGKVSRG